MAWGRAEALERAALSGFEEHFEHPLAVYPGLEWRNEQASRAAAAASQDPSATRVRQQSFAVNLELWVAGLIELDPLTVSIPVDLRDDAAHGAQDEVAFEPEYLASPGFHTHVLERARVHIRIAPGYPGQFRPRLAAKPWQGCRRTRSSGSRNAPRCARGSPWAGPV